MCRYYTLKTVENSRIGMNGNWKSSPGARSWSGLNAFADRTPGRDIIYRGEERRDTVGVQAGLSTDSPHSAGSLHRFDY